MPGKAPPAQYHPAIRILEKENFAVNPRWNRRSLWKNCSTGIPSPATFQLCPD